MPFTRRRFSALALAAVVLTALAGCSPAQNEEKFKVVTTFTEWLTGLLPNTEDFFSGEAGSFGAFLNALISFLIMGAVVYFFIVMPYTKARERFFPTEEAGAAPDVALLEEIRDLLKARGGAV